MSEPLPPEPVPDGVDGHSIGTRYAACYHCGTQVRIVGGRYVTHKRPEGDHCRDSGRPLHRD